MSRWFRNVTEPLRALEELTRPPRRPFADLDEPLAEREAEEEFSEPRSLAEDRGTGAINDGEPQQVTLSGREYERYLDGALNDAPADVPNPYEPQLSDDELVGVRELLERFGLADVPTPSAAGDSPSEVCGHSPVPPSEGRPTSELLAEAAEVIDESAWPENSSDAALRALAAELRARAEVFRRVEDEGHDVGLSWAAETFPQFQNPQK